MRFFSALALVLLAFSSLSAAASIDEVRAMVGQYEGHYFVAVPPDLLQFMDANSIIELYVDNQIVGYAVVEDGRFTQLSATSPGPASLAIQSTSDEVLKIMSSDDPLTAAKSAFARGRLGPRTADIMNTVKYFVLQLGLYFQMLASGQL